MGNLSAIKINDGLIRINERNEQGLNVDAWLVLGNEKAVLIDAVQDTILLHEMVTSLTHLPLEVIITHGHPDHAGKGLRAFMEHGVPVYIHPDDKPLLKKRNLFTTEETEQMLSLTEGMQFELGNRTLEILECAGHTPGSICVMDFNRQEVFTGDAIGSGVFWMQLEESLEMHAFVENLLHFKQNLIGMKDMIIYPGHIDQQTCQMGMQYIDDILHICSKLCTDGACGEAGEMELDGTKLFYRGIGFGQLHLMLYNPEKL